MAPATANDASVRGGADPAAEKLKALNRPAFAAAENEFRQAVSNVNTVMVALAGAVRRGEGFSIPNKLAMEQFVAHAKILEGYAQTLRNIDATNRAKVL